MKENTLVQSANDDFIYIQGDEAIKRRAELREKYVIDMKSAIKGATLEGENIGRKKAAKGEGFKF